MNGLSNVLAKSGQTLKRNAPEIFTGMGVVGVFTTSYLAGKASIQAADLIRKVESEEGTHSDKKERTKERIKLVWKIYIPTAASAVVTSACIIGSTHSSNRRTAAAVAAYSFTENAFSAYKEKVVEQIGETKEQKIRDEIAQERISDKPPPDKSVIIAGTGDVLCCELFTGRYFKCDMEKLRRVNNEVNARIIQDLYVTLDSFYDQVGLEHTSNSDLMGWTDGKIMMLDFTSTLTPEGTPCLAFDYSYIQKL